MARLSSPVAAIVIFLTPAAAQVRPYVPGMSCSAAASMVGMRGAVTIATGPNTYERVVSNGGFCSNEETSVPAWERTSDNPTCFIGYRCKDRNNDSNADRGNGG